MELKMIAGIKPTLAHANFSVLDAVRLMASTPADAIVVVDIRNVIQGIFTERDNLTRITVPERDPRRTQLDQVMTAPVITATLNTTIDQALETMFRHHFRHLPIVNDDNAVTGIVSARDLLMRRIGEKEAALQTLEAYVTAGGPG